MALRFDPNIQTWIMADDDFAVRDYITLLGDRGATYRNFLSSDE
jgi:hypothetical protein